MNLNFLATFAKPLFSHFQLMKIQPKNLQVVHPAVALWPSLTANRGTDEDLWRVSHHNGHNPSPYREEVELMMTGWRKASTIHLGAKIGKRSARRAAQIEADLGGWWIACWLELEVVSKN